MSSEAMCGVVEVSSLCPLLHNRVHERAREEFQWRLDETDLPSALECASPFAFLWDRVEEGVA